MDNLAHALVGAAAARAVADGKVARAGLIGAVAANAPDWTELFIGLPGPRAAYLELHRGITHSLAGAAIEIVGLTLLIGLGAWLWGRARRRPPPLRWGALTAAITVAVLSHPFMDWQGSYGLRPFLPWNDTWYYGDWVAIVDVLFWVLPLTALAWGSERHWRPLAAVLATLGFTSYLVVRTAGFIAPWIVALYFAVVLLLLAGWVRHWFGPAQRRRVAAGAVLLLAGYSLSHGVVLQFRKAEIRDEAVRRFGSGATWAALTEAGWPYHWEAMYASADSVAGEGWAVPRRLDRPEVRIALRETVEGRAIAHFARFLVADVDSSAGGRRRVFLWDARYARAGRDTWAGVSVSLDWEGANRGR